MLNLTKTLKIIFILILLSSTGCNPLLKKPVKREFSLQKDYIKFSPQKFKDEIEKLQYIVQNSQSSSLRLNAHLCLALIHLHHKNPLPDYLSSLREFEIYVSQKPNNQINDEILNFIKVLKLFKSTNSRFEEVKNEVSGLSKLNKKLEINIKIKKSEINKLKTEIEELKGKIKKLDSLYFQIEKKKRKKI